MATADHTIRLSDGAWRRLQRLAEREGVTPDVAAERAVDRALGAGETRPARDEDTSALDRVADRVGTFDGPEDLSTNKSYLGDLGAPSALERAGALIGSVEGPGDLSTREGFGR